MALQHFEWKDAYSVKVKIIDEQHKNLFKIIDELYQSILAGNQKENLPEILKQLNDYANYHFSTEEKYFKKFNYKEADVHIAIHQTFKKRLAGMEAKASNKNFDGFELLVFLQNWWVNHILDIDKKYSENFNQHGLK